jgi:hypothetical protein
MCSRCNIALFSIRATQFWARTPTRSVQVCNRLGAGSFGKQSILRTPARSAERECSADIFCNQPPRGSGVSCGKTVNSMRSLFILVAICFSGTVFAQSAPPKVGNKALVQVKPKAPMGCKFVGTVRGTKLWAGDCVEPELRGSTTATESQALPEETTGSITPAQKE